MEYYFDREGEPFDGQWELNLGVWACSDCGRSPNPADCWPDYEDEPPFAFCPWCGAHLEKHEPY